MAEVAVTRVIFVFKVKRPGGHAESTENVLLEVTAGADITVDNMLQAEYELRAQNKYSQHVQTRYAGHFIFETFVKEVQDDQTSNGGAEDGEGASETVGPDGSTGDGSIPESRVVEDAGHESDAPSPDTESEPAPMAEQPTGSNNVAPRRVRPPRK